MAAIRVLAGLAMTFFAAAYFLIGMLFIQGDASQGPYGPAFAVFGMLGICAPVILCGMHLVLFRRRRPLWAHGAMVAALALALVASILAMLPFALATPPNPEADNVVLGAVVMAALFGWPMVRGLVRVLVSRSD